ADAATVLAVDAAVAAVADKLTSRLPETGRNDRRVAALALLANPAAHTDPSFDLDAGVVEPRVEIYLHLTDRSLLAGSPIARMEGHGPVTTDWVRHLLGGALGPLARAPKVKVAPVIDLNNQSPV